MTVCLLSGAQNKLMKAFYMINTLLNKLVRSRRLYVSLFPFFCLLMDLDSNLVHKNAPEELDKNAAIMTLCLVKGAFM